MRIFRDREGTEWRVWQVAPQTPVALERRKRERRRTAGEYAGPERRADAERRTLVSNGMPNEWLCFECKQEKRRLMIVPPEWELVADDRLEMLCRMASPTRRVLDPGPEL